MDRHRRLRWKVVAVGVGAVIVVVVGGGTGLRKLRVMGRRRRGGEERERTGRLDQVTASIFTAKEPQDTQH